MAFPITVDATLSSAEQPGKYGPFLSGSARYQIILRLTQPSGGPTPPTSYLNKAPTTAIPGPS